MRRGRLNAGDAEQRVDRDATPLHVELRPGRDAMDRAVVRVVWQRLDLVPRPRCRTVDEPFDGEGPCRKVELRCDLRRQDRPRTSRVVLARWQPRVAWASVAAKRARELGHRQSSSVVWNASRNRMRRSGGSSAGGAPSTSCVSSVPRINSPTRPESPANVASAQAPINTHIDAPENQVTSARATPKKPNCDSFRVTTPG